MVHLIVKVRSTILFIVSKMQNRADNRTIIDNCM